jgi:NADPH-dependent 2,4-dienoyl-CoA reductase/sulfur reductase-like enzyme
VSDDARDLPAGAGRGAPLTIDFEGQSLRAFAGESVAVALWANDVRTLGRSSKYHRPRGAFCLDGHCASCYLRIDGRPNLRACMTPAVPGLRCERQNAFPNVDVDLLTVRGGSACRRVVEAHPEEVARFRGGTAKVMGFFVGAVMKETGGKANPKSVNEILRRLLGPA